MGTPADPDEPDYTKGDSCELCSDAIFNGHTPQYVQANIEGVEICPPLEELPDGFGGAILKQRAAAACHWSAEVPRNGDFHNYDWIIKDIITGGSSFTYDITGGGMFGSIVAEPCIASFGNQLNCVSGDLTFGGTVGITWGPGINQEAYDAQF